MRRMTKELLFLFFLLAHLMIYGQGRIIIDHKTQRFIGDISTLDRTKYIHAYLTIRGNDPRFTALKEEYNFHPDYIGGRSLSNPASRLNSNTMPPVGNKYSGVREVDPWYVTGGRPTDIFWDETADYSAIDVNDYMQDLAEYVASSLAKEWDNLGRYFEPMNEPMVKAKDLYPGGFNSAKNDKIITDMCNYHDYVGKAIHDIPELENILVTGYASAFPEFESDNFEFWEKRFGKFIDIAGEEMDVLSIHIYDGSGVNNQSGRRSGSNSEALLDIIEAYSFIKFGQVKPLAVTEYGRLVPNQPNWAEGNGESNYEPVTNSQAVRSQLHLVMNFMERADHFELAIPFNTNRGDDPTFIFAKASLWTKNENGEIVLSMRKFFYEMLKDLKGERARINSSNVDIQVQSFVDGTELYVMLNNLNDETQTVDLDLLNQEGLMSVDIKQLKIFTDRTPELTNTTVTSAPENISLEYGETAVLTYHFAEEIAFENTITSTKYYTSTYLSQIQSRTINSFSFQPIDVTYGTATLRMGVGREHGLSLAPRVKINGELINAQGDLIKGDDQRNRSQFFGVLEIPFSVELLNASGQNVVEVEFPDDGGKISSVILQVDKAVNAVEVELPDPLQSVDNHEGFIVFPNQVPAGTEVNILSNGVIPTFTISTISGAQMFSGTGNTITTHSLKSGVYLVRIQNDVSVVTQKLIIE
ncbi:MAG: T9SS type A sorting domain-containing protein [Bacteroidota bacterium]